MLSWLRIPLCLAGFGSQWTQVLVGASASVHLLQLGQDRVSATSGLSASVSAGLTQRLAATALGCEGIDPLIAASASMVVVACEDVNLFLLSEEAPHQAIVPGGSSTGGSMALVRSLALASSDLFMRVAHVTSASLQRLPLNLDSTPWRVDSTTRETVATWAGGAEEVEPCLSCVSVSEEGVVATLGDCSAGGAVELWKPSGGTWSRAAIVEATALASELSAGDASGCSQLK